MHRYGVIIFWCNEDEASGLQGTAHDSSQREALENARESIELCLDTARPAVTRYRSPKTSSSVRAKQAGICNDTLISVYF